ncbi:MAG: transglycosylase SLT domain-containing protein [Bacteroidia bacterium]|nr:transglycosylase SLT domain-containing protein [Bacteroidia bacterium]
MKYVGITLLALIGLGASLWAQPKSNKDLIEVVVLKDTLLQKVVRDIELDKDKWDLLPEIRFWRKVMKLEPELCILNNAKTREMYQIFPTILYDTLPDEKKPIFKDSLIKILDLDPKTPLYVTYGKQNYYKFDKILSDINEGIHYFHDEQVDPWYAQTILLIESPGFSRTSPTGARGRFQLMKSVAIRQGLKVNSQVDEREDLEKSARAAANYMKQVCIPQAKRMLLRRRHTIDESSLAFRLLVMHIYHAGASNVSGALRQIPYSYKEMELIKKLWHTSYRGFRNASQNYSQIAVAALLELNEIVEDQCSILCLAK